MGGEWDDYEAWLEETAKDCWACPQHHSVPCDGCQAGGVCDGPDCARCSEREADDDEFYRSVLDDLDDDDDEHAPQRGGGEG